MTCVIVGQAASRHHWKHPMPPSKSCTCSRRWCFPPHWLPCAPPHGPPSGVLLSPLACHPCAPGCSGHGRCWCAHLGDVRSSLHRPAVSDLCHPEWPGSGVAVWHGHPQVRPDVALPLVRCALLDAQQQQHGSLCEQPCQLRPLRKQPLFSQPDCLLSTARKWVPTPLAASNKLLTALNITCMLGSKAHEDLAAAVHWQPYLDWTDDLKSHPGSGQGLCAGGRVIMMDDFAWLRELLAHISSTRVRLQRWHQQRGWDPEEGTGLISSAAGHTE